jgi:hypothetical protein
VRPSRYVVRVAAAIALVVALAVPAASGATNFLDPSPRISGWQNVTGLTDEAPSARAYAATAVDAYDGVSVLVGGQAAGGQAVPDAWFADDGHWENGTGIFGPHAPPPLSHAAMALDRVDNLDVLTGGYGSSGTPNNETFTFSNFNWTNATATVGTPPPGGASGLMATDPSTGAAVWVPGASTPGTAGRVWEFQHHVWTVRSVSGGPAIDLTGAAFFEDPAAEAAVLYTPSSAGGPSTTWAYSSGVWTLLDTGGLPTLVAPSMTYDPGLSAVLLSGAVAGETDLYAFGNSHWTNETPTSGPPPTGRHGAILLYDPTVGSVRFFGGVPAPGGPAPLGDTWTWGSVLPPLDPTLQVAPLPGWAIGAAGAALVVPPVAVLALRVGGRGGSTATTG